VCPLLGNKKINLILFNLKYTFSVLLILFVNTVPVSMFDLQSVGIIPLDLNMWSMGEAVCHNVLQHDSIQKLIHLTDLNFDVVIVETFVYGCFLGFAHKFQTPIIHVFFYSVENNMADSVGSTNTYYYVPEKTNPHNRQTSMLWRDSSPKSHQTTGSRSPH
jgi:hypothetical protein